MTNKNTMIALLGIFSVMIITTFAASNAYAHEIEYKYADNLKPIVTFEFKDGTETHEFPVYIMEDDFVDNNGSQIFTLQGTVDNATPHLHKALDEAFKYRQSLSFEWDYKYFDVQIDFTNDDRIVETIKHHDCKINDYGIITIDDDYESYTGGKVGFAVIDDIEFLCGGLNFQHYADSVKYDPNTVVVMEQPWAVSDDIRTFVEFEFDQGIERIEFPVFRTISGFEESTSRLIPTFELEGLLMEHPLLSKAIDNARSIKGIPTYSNIDFEATVEFVQNGTTLRGIEYTDCRVDEYDVKTQFDKEEGWTGKRGFAVTEAMQVECIGIEGLNPRFSEVYPEGLTWRTDFLEYEPPMRDRHMADELLVKATFDFDNGVEVAYFPEFDQLNVLDDSRPAFTLTGLVGDYPQLYSKADENLDIQFTTGAHNFIEMFGVDVEIIKGGQTIRAFEYNDCRVIDYDVKTEEDNEESYFKSFALTNEFDFECQGYHPYNPVFDAMFEYEKPKLKSSMDYESEQIARGGTQPLFG